MTPKELREITSQFTVLYVEDDKPLQESTAKLFMQFFKQVDVANDGKEGLEKYDDNEYDIVISDINMPKINGVEMVRSIKKQNSEQLILITSAYSDAENLLALMDVGVTKFVLKPLNLTKLMDALIHIALQKKIQTNPDVLLNTQTISELKAKISSLEAKLANNQKDKVPEQPEHTLSASDLALFDLLENTLLTTIREIHNREDMDDIRKEKLLNTIDTYANHLENMQDGKELMLTLFKLDHSIEDNEDIFATKIVDASTMLEQMVLNIQAWRTTLTKDAHTLALKSIKKILAFLRP